MARHHQAGIGPEDSASPPSATVTKEKVIQDFSHLYFKILNEQPELLPQFYGDDSSVVACECHNQGPSFKVCADNKEDIKKHLEIFEKITVELTTCAQQFSMGDSIMLLVTGTLTKEGLGDDQQRLFTQAFLLAKQNEGFYIRTDTLQIHSNRCSTNILTNRLGNSPIETPPPKQSKAPVNSEVSPGQPDLSMSQPPSVEGASPGAPPKDQVPHPGARQNAAFAPTGPKPKPIQIPGQAFQTSVNQAIGDKPASGAFLGNQISDGGLPTFGSLSAEQVNPSLNSDGASADFSFGKVPALAEGVPSALGEGNNPGDTGVENTLGRRKYPMANQRDQPVEPPSTFVKPIEKPPQRQAPLQCMESNVDMGVPNKRKSYVDVLRRNPVGLAENRVTPTANPIDSAPVSAPLSRGDVQTPVIQNKPEPSRETTPSIQTPLSDEPSELAERAHLHGQTREPDQPQRKSYNDSRGGDGGSASQVELRSKLTSLFVCRLPPDITAKAVEQIFSRFGELRTGVRLLAGPKNRYTFVNFVSEEAVTAALKVEIKIGSKAIIVERWQPPKQDFRKNDFVRRQ